MIALKRNRSFARQIRSCLISGSGICGKEKKEPVSGYAYLAEGVPAALTLTSQEVSVTVFGQIPQAAKNQPMTKEKISRQLGKTGATAYELQSLRQR